jgi:parallel beta-helix repeat protein
MKNKTIATIIICMLLLSGLIITSVVGENSKIITSSGNTLYVGGIGPGNYTTIQGAINDATSGDTIFVFNGTYTENIVIDKSINLIGENKQITTINGNNAIAIKITVNSVTVDGFTIQNGDQGILLDHTGNSNINGNIISNNNCGIFLHGAISNNIKNNIISDNKCGIEVGPSASSGKFHPSNNNIISFNNFIDNVKSVFDNYEGSYDKNQWTSNYWSEWIGLKFEFLKIFPKIIFGRPIPIIGELGFPICFTFDWTPSETQHLL